VKLSQLFDDGVPEQAKSVEADGITADSRKVRPGSVFAALSGALTHGKAFVDQAISNGAVAILSAGDLDMAPGVPHVVDSKPRLALARAAQRLHPTQPQIVAAITGTNGKSSTVDFLRQIWTHAGKPAASLGTLGAIGPEGVIDLGHTTPDPVAIHQTLEALARQGVTHAAMEASSHGLDQFRLDAVRLSAGGFTNLTQDHLDYHETMDAYREAKLRLWGLLPAGAPAIVNADAVAAPDFEARATARGLSLVTCGWRATDLKISEVWPRPAGQRLDLLWKGKSYAVELPLIGEFQALNAVTAAALALSLGEDIHAVIGGLEVLKPVRGRIEHVGSTQAGAHVFVDYAHTPDGLDVLLRAARPHAPGRLVLVFGCGGDRDRTKRPKMGDIAARHADVVIVTDDNPRTEDAASIRSAIMDAVPEALEIGDRGDAIRAGVNMLTSGDCLLIAGKGHETGQIVGSVVHPFSDQDTAEAAIRAAGGRIGGLAHG
jgi:UDP-N-acetylmuramoyl-L-alanyl-D-glutamate--2,6-diaminopimelate ligase